MARNTCERAQETQSEREEQRVARQVMTLLGLVGIDASCIRPYTGSQVNGDFDFSLLTVTFFRFFVLMLMLTLMSILIR